MIQIIAFSSKAAITFITTGQGAPARKLSGERKEKLNIYLLYPIPHLLVLFQMLHVERETSRKKQSQQKKNKSRQSPPSPFCLQEAPVHRYYGCTCLGLKSFSRRVFSNAALTQAQQMTQSLIKLLKTFFKLNSHFFQ